MSDEARKTIADVISRHHMDPDNYGDRCLCGFKCWKGVDYNYHVAAEIDTALGGLGWVSGWTPEERP